jgi:hypothetical protein
MSFKTTKQDKRLVKLTVLKQKTMQQVTLNIPDQQMEFFLQLVNKLGFEMNKLNEFDIPEEHKTIVRERIRTADSREQLSWKEARKQLKFKE